MIYGLGRTELREDWKRDGELVSGLPCIGSRSTSPLKNRAVSEDSLEMVTVGTRSMTKLTFGEGPLVQ